MSKVKIQGNASGTGVVTLTAPNTNTDRTITLPDSTGSILDSTSTLDATKLSGALPALDGSALTNLPGGGKVLQVTHDTGTKTGATANTSSYWEADSTWRPTITPSSTSSKIYGIFSFSWYGDIDNDGHGTVQGQCKISRYVGGSSIQTVIESDTPIVDRAGHSRARTLTYTFLISPNTTSACEFRTFVRTASSSNGRNLGVHAGIQSTATLMEISV